MPGVGDVWRSSGCFRTPARSPFTVRETEPGTPELRLTVTAGELRTTAGEATGITLEPTNSPVTGSSPARPVRVELAPSAAPSPGSLRREAHLDRAALGQATTVDVGYRVRLSVALLVLLLLLGIGSVGGSTSGWRPGRRSIRSVLSGLRAIQSMTRRVTPQRDPAVQQRLLAVANLLQSNWQESGAPGRDQRARIGGREPGQGDRDQGGRG